MALYEITNILGIDDEEKELIFENLFISDETGGPTIRRETNEEIYEKEEDQGICGLE